MQKNSCLMYTHTHTNTWNVFSRYTMNSLQSQNLVFHQWDEGTDNDRSSFGEHRRKLETKTFAISWNRNTVIASDGKIMFDYKRSTNYRGQCHVYILRIYVTLFIYLWSPSLGLSPLQLLMSQSGIGRFSLIVLHYCALLCKSFSMMGFCGSVSVLVR